MDMIGQNRIASNGANRIKKFGGAAGGARKFDGLRLF
jgi:hypothetical protein